MNYGHSTGYNLLPTYADGIISPDILSMVHKMKSEAMKPMKVAPKREQDKCVPARLCQIFSAVRKYCHSVLGNHSNLLPEQISKKWRLRSFS